MNWFGIWGVVIFIILGSLSIYPKFADFEVDEANEELDMNDFLDTFEDSDGDLKYESKEMIGEDERIFLRDEVYKVEFIDPGNFTEVYFKTNIQTPLVIPGNHSGLFTQDLMIKIPINIQHDPDDGDQQTVHIDTDGISYVSKNGLQGAEPAPNAKISVRSTDLTVFNSITFSGLASSGNVINYYWDFGDGEFAEESIVTHRYSQTGEYRVKLTVEGISGKTDKAWKNLNITLPVGLNETLNIVHLAEILKDQNVIDGEYDEIVGYLPGSKIYLADCVTNIHYLTSSDQTELYFGNYDFLYLQTEGDLRDFYRIGDPLFIQLRVEFNSMGYEQLNFSKRDIYRLGHNDYDLDISFVKASMIVDQKTTSSDMEFFCNGNASLGDILEYHWDFGDGMVGKGESVTHVYSGPGIYALKLTTLGRDGKSDTDVKQITVRPEQVNDVFNKWTIFFYLNGDNDYEEEMEELFNELETVGSTDEITLILQIDKKGIDNPGVHRYLITRDDSENIIASIPVDQSNTECNMGDPDELVDFLKWGMTNYPSLNYGLVITDHYNDPSGFGFDENTGNDEKRPVDRLKITELRTALSSLDNSIPPSIDLLVLDNGYTASLENLFELRDCTEILIAPEGSIHKNTISYQNIITSLIDDPGLSPHQTAELFIAEIADQNTLNNGLCTICAFDLDNIDCVIDDLNKFLLELYDRLKIVDRDIYNSRKYAAKWFNDELVDVVEFITNVEHSIKIINLKEQAQLLCDSINRTIIASEIQPVGRLSGGLSLYFPEKFTPYRDRYEFIHFTIWLNFLAEYYVMIEKDPMKDRINYNYLHPYGLQCSISIDENGPIAEKKNVSISLANHNPSAVTNIRMFLFESIINLKNDLRLIAYDGSSYDLEPGGLISLELVWIPNNNGQFQLMLKTDFSLESKNHSLINRKNHDILQNDGAVVIEFSSIEIMRSSGLTKTSFAMINERNGPINDCRLYFALQNTQSNMEEFVKLDSINLPMNVIKVFNFTTNQRPGLELIEIYLELPPDSSVSENRYRYLEFAYYSYPELPSVSGFFGFYYAPYEYQNLELEAHVVNLGYGDAKNIDVDIIDQSMKTGTIKRISHSQSVNVLPGLDEDNFYDRRYPIGKLEFNKIKYRLQPEIGEHNLRIEINIEGAGNYISNSNDEYMFVSTQTPEFSCAGFRSSFIDKDHYAISIEIINNGMCNAYHGGIAVWHTSINSENIIGVEKLTELEPDNEITVVFFYDPDLLLSDVVIIEFYCSQEAYVINNKLFFMI